MAFWDTLKNIGEAVGGIGLQLLGGEQNKANTKKAQERQFNYQKQLNQQAYDLNYKMFQNTGYEAQKKQLQDAGLNAGLLYGMGGSGGASAGSQSGGSAAGMQAAPSQLGGTMPLSLAQLGIMKAQKENIEADTTLKNEQATGTKAGTTETLNRIDEIKQNIKNSKAQELLTNVQKRLADMQLWEANASQEDRMNSIKWGAERAYQEFLKATEEAYIAVNSRDDVLAQIKAESVGAIINNMLKQKQIEVSDAQITKMANDIAQGWKDLDIKDESNAINVFKAEIEKAYPSLWQTMGRMANDAISATWKLGGKERPRYEEYKK